jgi:hypothetical protein
MSTSPLVLNGKTFFRHTYSEVFPLMSGDDYNLLVQSIRETGLRVPIKLIGEDQVFDGWNRLRACAKTGVEPLFESVDESDDLGSLTVAFNLACRHLTAGQKGLIAGQLANIGNGGKRPGAGRQLKNVRHDDDGHDHDETVLNQDLISDLDGSAEYTYARANTSSRESPPQFYDENRSLKAAAAHLGVSRTTAAMGKRIVESGEASLIDAVKAGRIPLAEAYRIAQTSEAEQRDHVKKRLAEGGESQKAARKPRELSVKLARALLNGEQLPEDISDAQWQQALFKACEISIAAIDSCTRFVGSYKSHCEGSLVSHIHASNKALAEVLVTFD